MALAHRIEEGYRRRFRTLLARVRPRRLDFGVDLLIRRARDRSASEAVPFATALARLYEETRQRVERRVALMQACSVAPAEAPRPTQVRFVCDGSLGGLARWLRAAGYEAEWAKGRSGRALAASRPADAILLTSDARLAAEAGEDSSLLWVPSMLQPAEQLHLVLADLGLPAREPRCMGCGGVLRPVAKEAVRERIPPRTARWKDDYFLCEGCGQLFWRGTHWERIAARLAQAAPA
ncbi:MAG TPA: Mut7-C RNAse domain-containing protein [Vicinamibacteria bacterium]